MIHVVFNEPDIKVLEEAIGLDESLSGEIFLIRDDYSVGPLDADDTPQGWQARRDWWYSLLESTGEGDAQTRLEMVDDKLTVHQITKKLEEDPAEKIWIWAAQNKHDVSGYYWLISRMAAWQGRVFILYLNNLPFINDKGGIFYPQWLSQIPPREFLKAKKLARPITPSEFEVDTDEWLRLGREGKMVRLLEGGKKLLQKDVDLYDAGIDQYIGGDFVKGARVVQLFLSKEKETTGDVFVLWRLKQLIAEKGYEVKGDLTKSSKDFDVRNPAKPVLKKKAEEEGGGWGGG
jgi:Domain of unknown function (DUF1835)/Protein of unknown function